MKLWQWQDGRQNKSRYRKFPLWYFRIWKWGFDAYILSYEPFTRLPVHTDKVTNGNHYRLNIPIAGNSTFHWLGEASRLYGKNSIWVSTKGIAAFRPDIQPHYLKVGDRGATKLSFGFVKYKQ